MKRNFIFVVFLFLTCAANAQNKDWKIVDGHITSPWADSIDPSNVLPEYPRPQMQRSNWQNLNGVWQYAILPIAESEVIPKQFHGNILVPFAVESALSGV